MSKPSIFSKDYEKIRRRKKRRIAIVVICIVFLSLGVAFSGKVKVWTKNSFNIKSSLNFFKKSDKDQKKNTDEKAKKDNEAKEQQAQQVKAQQQQQEEKGYPVTLSSGKQIKLVYDEINNDKKFKFISPEASGVVYTINASGKNIVILDDKNQNLICFDVNGNQTDITKKEYVSDSQEVFAKDAILTSKPDYLWHSTPKFIDEENVAYISQMPWFNNQATKYVWIVNIKNNNHLCKSNLTGESISFGEIDQTKGLAIKILDKTYYLKGTGEVQE